VSLLQTLLQSMCVCSTDKLGDLFEVEGRSVGLHHFGPLPSVEPGLDAPGSNVRVAATRSRREFHPSGGQRLCVFAGRIATESGADFRSESSTMLAWRAYQATPQAANGHSPLIAGEGKQRV
jgi:hypothetical protein